MGEYFLGIDGGQSSTTAMLGDRDGRVVGFGQGGPCNHVEGPGGREKFINAIEACVSQAAPSISREDIHALCGGFSGGPHDKQQLLAEMFPASQVFVTTDATIALAGATAGEPGVIVIGGTGSIAFGRNAFGETARAGGWGYVFGDEGGGFDITRQALRACLRAEEGWGPPTTLAQSFLEATGATSMNDLLHRFYTTAWPRPKIAALSKLVDAAAESGDQIAQGILHSAAHELAGYTSAVRGKLFHANEPARIAWIGGVFRSARLLSRFRTLLEIDEANTCAPPIHGPAAGALLEAYRNAGVTVSLRDVPALEK
jgi:N-acetylglucosamine kinase-like BadF-type ATPase